MNIQEKIDRIDEEIRLLQERRKVLVKNRQTIQRLALTKPMAEVLAVVRNNPGIDTQGIIDLVQFDDPKDYNNTMTSLRRRNLIVNKGTRRNPFWLPVTA